MFCLRVIKARGVFVLGWWWAGEEREQGARCEGGGGGGNFLYRA